MVSTGEFISAASWQLRCEQAEARVKELEAEVARLKIPEVRALSQYVSLDVLDWKAKAERMARAVVEAWQYGGGRTLEPFIDEARRILESA